MAKITVTPASDNGLELIFPNMKEGEVTFVDNESHGQGPIGRFADIENGGKRLIISSPNVATVYLEQDD